MDKVVSEIYNDIDTSIQKYEGWLGWELEQNEIKHLKHFAHGGGGCISLGNPYLKIFDLKKIFIVVANMKKKKNSFTPSQGTLKYGSKNHPWPKGLIECPQISCPDKSRP